MNDSSLGERKPSILVTLILAGETIFFLPFLIARIFRPTMLDVFEISNVQLGSFFSTYGIVAMLSYIFGGPLADKYPSRVLMAIALWLTGIGGFIMAFIPSPIVMRFVYGFWGFTTIFLFWAPMIRSTREWGGSAFQGRAYGWLEGGRGAVAATLGIISWILFAWKNAGNTNTPGMSASTEAFQLVVLSISVITFIIGWLVWRKIPENRSLMRRESPKRMLSKIGQLLKLPGIWAMMFIIICAYAGYKITDDFSLYAREVFGFSETKASFVGAGALWLRALVAFSVGFLADHLVKIRMIAFFFILSIIAGLIAWAGFLQFSALLALLNLSFLATGIYGIRALYFAIQQEARIPLPLTGAAVGILSFVGYTPDVFMSPWMGHLLDADPGAGGHQNVFLLLAMFSLLGLLSTIVFSIFNGKSRRLKSVNEASIL